jgi:hypothetical protein
LYCVSKNYFGFLFRSDFEGETDFGFLTGFAGLFFVITFFFDGIGLTGFFGNPFFLLVGIFDTFGGVFFTGLTGFFGLLATGFTGIGFFVGFLTGLAGNFFGAGLGTGFAAETSLADVLGLLTEISVFGAGLVSLADSRTGTAGVAGAGGRSRQGGMAGVA